MLMLKSKKGTATMGSIITVTIGIIVLVGVSIPVALQVIDEQNLTGLTATIVGFIPVFLALAGLVLVASMLKA